MTTTAQGKRARGTQIFITRWIDDTGADCETRHFTEYDAWRFEESLEAAGHSFTSHRAALSQVRS